MNAFHFVFIPLIKSTDVLVSAIQNDKNNNCHEIAVILPPTLPTTTATTLLITDPLPIEVDYILHSIPQRLIPEVLQLCCQLQLILSNSPARF